MTEKIESDNDDQWLEDEIQQQLDQLDDDCLLNDDEQHSHEAYLSESDLSSVDTKVLIKQLVCVPHLLKMILLNSDNYHILLCHQNTTFSVG